MNNDFLPKNKEITMMTAGDGMSLRTGFFPAENDAKSTILLLNGHREFLEKYSEFIEDLQKRGYNVYSMDHRGQGGSGRALENRSKSHNPDFDLIIDDIHQFVVQRIKPENPDLPLFLLSHSLGSQFAMRYLHDYPDVFERALLLSPFTDLDHRGPFYVFFAKLFFVVMNFLGFSEHFVLGQPWRREMIDHDETFSVLTHDKARYQWSEDALTAKAELFIGGVTYGWIAGAQKSVSLLKSRGYMEKIHTPLLCLLSGEEKVVNNKTTISLMKRAPHATIEYIKGARHEIYREIDDIRDKLWQKIEETFTVS